MSLSYYVSRTRYKCAFVFIASVLIIWLNVFLMGSSVMEVLKTYGIMSLYLLTAGCFLWLPAFQYRRKSAFDIWKRWGEHRHLLRRKDFEDVKFHYIYEDKKYAVMKDPKEAVKVSTTLMSCTCRAFKQEKLPCRHMCKLADLLEVYEADYRSWDQQAKERLQSI